MCKDTPNIALPVKNLRKTYKQVVVVKALDLVVRKGECFGLLGPNGAGCCARAGARRVYAIEANEKSYRASQMALVSQGIDNVHLICGFSDKVDLPERCDVLVHDLIGDIGSSEGVVPFVEDTKRRLLKPGAVHIPWRCTTYFVLAEDPTLRFSERALGYWLRGFAAYEGLRFVRFFSFLAAALAEPAIFEDFVFAETSVTRTSRRVAVTIERHGMLRGAHFFIRLHPGGRNVIDTRSGQTSWSTPLPPVRCPNAGPKGGRDRGLHRNRSVCQSNLCADRKANHA